MPVSLFDCELVLQENGHEWRQAHSFMVEMEPGTFVHIEGRDWIVTEVREQASAPPEIICRPAAERPDNWSLS
jgi:hypothetical protein